MTRETYELIAAVIKDLPFDPSLRGIVASKFAAELSNYADFDRVGFERACGDTSAFSIGGRDDD